LPRKPWRAATRVPSFSGKQSAGLLGGCLVASALLFPLLLRLPVWVEAELVLLAWWLIWCVALTWMLHAGRRIVDDHRWSAPETRGWGNAVDGFSLDATPDADGCLGLVAGIAVGILLFVGLWALWEVVLPAVALVGYLLVRGMVAHVINDPHDCKKNLGRSLVWGLFWATAYTGPLAALVWALHRWAFRA